MKTDYKSTREIKGKLLSLLLTAAMVFTMMFTLPPITAYAASADVNTYGELTTAVADAGIDTINVTNGFSLEADVTIDRTVTINSDWVYTISADTHSFIIGSGGSVSLDGSLSLTGTSTTIQVLDGGALILPASYTGTISATGAGGKAVYASGGTAAVNISGGTIEAGPDANSALCLADTDSVTVSGGVISGSGGAYGVYMEQGYGTVNIKIGEGEPSVDGIYYYWNPSDAPELAGDYPLLTRLPAPISMGIGEVKTVDVEGFTSDYASFSYILGDYPEELNVVDVLENDNLTLSPETAGVFNLVLRIRGVVLTIPVTVTSGFAGGVGTEIDPFQIATAEQLDRVRNFLGSTYKDTYFKLTAPIDLSLYTNWEPIGDLVHPFCGHLLGAVYDEETETYILQTVSNLTINRPDENYVGLFGYCASAGIEYVAIRNADVTGGFAAGALVGQAVGFLGSDVAPTEIIGCSSTGSVTAANGNGGGLVGMASDSQVMSSYSTVSVTGTLSNEGGLVGYLNGGLIRDCYATGPVTSTGASSYAGGLAGWLFGDSAGVYYSYAAGHVTGGGETGGLIGFKGSDLSTIWDSFFNSANASASDDGSKGEGVTTYQIVQESPYPGSIDLYDHWDFEATWAIDEGASYPYLQKNEQKPHPAPPAATSARIVGDSGDSRYNASAKTLTMTYGDSGAYFSFENVTPADGLVIWSSSDTAVAGISPNGDGSISVGPVSAGTATVSLESSNGNTLDSVTVIVEPIHLTVIGNFAVANKEYDGNTHTIVTDSTLLLETTNCINGDEASLTANFAAVFSDSNAGQNKTVSLSTSTLTGSAAGNYVLDLASAPTTTADITPKELTISGSFTAQGKAYDGTTNAAIASNNLTLVGKVGSDDVTLVPFLSFDTPDIATGKTVSLTADSSLSGAKAENYTLSITGAPTYTSGVIAEKQASLGGSFTVNNKEYFGDKAAAIATNNLTLVGVHSGDDVSIASVTAEFDSAVVGNGKTVRITGVILTGANAGDYAVSLTGAPTATANITAKPLTITGSFTASNKSYDGSTAAVINSNSLALSGGIISGDSVTLNPVAAFVDTNAGTGKTVNLTTSTLTGDDAANYVIDFSSAPTTTADITKATGLSAPAAPALVSKTYNSVTLTPDEEYEFSKDNGVTWQLSNVFTGLTVSTEYSFVQRVSDNANHEPSPASEPLTVTTNAAPSGGSSGSSLAAAGQRFEVPEDFLSGSDGDTITFSSNAVSITVPSDMLSNIPGAEDKKAEITIREGDKESLPDNVKDAIGGRPLIRLTLLLDGKQTEWSNPDAPVTISIPYTPTAEELDNPESIVVWYIDGSGNIVCIPNGHYDPATGTVTFSTTHFSLYTVGYNTVSFNDAASTDWYYKAVSFIAARGITTGTGTGAFSPDAVLTRADFLVMLMKAYGIAPDANPAENFSDAGSTYYTGYLAAAKRLEISAGAGNNLYAPGKEITRQEMFTLLYNVLKVIGQLPQGDSGKTLSDFTDAGQIDTWAKEAMTLLAETGTVGGSGGKLTPTSTATRAEIAQVLYNLLSK